MHEVVSEPAFASGEPNPIVSRVFVWLSALLLALQLLIFAWWVTAFSAEKSHVETVRSFLAQLPFGLGRLSAANLTRLTAAMGLVGFATALLGARHLRDGWRSWAVGMAVANALLVLWYLFTMM